MTWRGSIIWLWKRQRLTVLDAVIAIADVLSPLTRWVGCRRYGGILGDEEGKSKLALTMFIVEISRGYLSR